MLLESACIEAAMSYLKGQRSWAPTPAETSTDGGD